MKVFMFSVLCSIMAFLLWAQFPPSQGFTPVPAASGIISGSVVDENGIAIAGAWVCATELLDENDDGFYTAISGFTDINGQFSLTAPSCQEHWLLSTACDGYRTYLDTVRTDATSFNDITMLPSEGDFLWGQLVGADVAGVRIVTPNTEPGAIAVTDANGIFALSFEVGGTLEFDLESLQTNVTVSFDTDAFDPTTNSLASPEIFAINANGRSFLSASVSMSDNTLVPTDALMYVYALDGGVDSVIETAAPVVAGAFQTKYAHNNGDDYRLVTVLPDGRWGASAPVSLPGANPAPVQIDASIPTCGVSLIVGHRDNLTIVPKGNIKVSLCLDDSNCIVPIKTLVNVASGDPLGILLSPGDYRFEWVVAGSVMGLVETTVTAGNMIEEVVVIQSTIRSVGGYAEIGAGAIVGTVSMVGGNMGEGFVALSQVDSDIVIRSAELDSSGSYSFSNLLPGNYRVSVCGQTDGLITGIQLGGDRLIAVVDGLSSQGDITLFSAPAVEIVAMKGLLNTATSVYDFDGFVPGVQVNLLDSNGTAIASATTDNLGKAYFAAISVNAVSVAYSHATLVAPPQTSISPASISNVEDGYKTIGVVFIDQP